MAARGDCQRLARRAYGFGDCSHISHEAVQLANECSRAGGDYCNGFGKNLATIAHRISRVGRTRSLCRDSNWQLDRLVEISVRRYHRIDSENCIPGLDTEAVRRLVAASDLYAARLLGLLVGFNRELLARRS